MEMYDRWADFGVISTIILSIMKAGAVQQGGKENQRLSGKSNRRKPTKSPFKIRQKIKELEEKAQQEEKRAILSKEKTNKKQLNVHNQKIVLLEPQKITRTPLQYLERDRYTWQSAHKASNHPLKEIHSKPPVRVEGKAIKMSKSPLPLQKSNSSRDSRGAIVHKFSVQTLASDNGHLTHLKQENQRYKRIYSHSLKKMQQLQAKLQAIRQEHEEEKGHLEDTMEGLRQRIDQKKIVIGHLYTHTQHNFQIQNDLIITETQNESSSILQNLSKRFRQPSSLSIDSR